MMHPPVAARPPRPRRLAVPVPAAPYARLLMLSVLLGAAGLVVPRAWGADAQGTPTEHRPVARGASQPAKEAATAEAATDPLAHLQQRLAAKFGGRPTSEALPDGQVLRVVARGTEPPAATPARKSPKPVRAIEAGHELHWSYEGEGAPGQWGKLRPEFALCGSGKRQSPIDIRDGIKLVLDPVQFDYKPSAFKVVDNGHTIQVDVAPGSGIEVLGERFELQQFHFHRPSEESIDGRRFDMVAHFVHKSLEGRLAVVAVLIEKGAAQAQLQQVWNNVPLEKGSTVNARGALELERLLPADRGYFTYMGSLTTPPCSEGVLWMVMKQPVQASPEQLGIFARLYPMNARPIQSASGRLIKESN
ncbi:MAG TPA: carbonic anhydrase family protein [Burkholderiaceae bacterium]|nr:carbonic anhydrase family protein [Burkholderiaceae bacterium]